MVLHVSRVWKCVLAYDWPIVVGRLLKSCYRLTHFFHVCVQVWLWALVNSAQSGCFGNILLGVITRGSSGQLLTLIIIDCCYIALFSTILQLFECFYNPPSLTWTTGSLTCACDLCFCQRHNCLNGTALVCIRLLWGWGGGVCRDKLKKIVRKITIKKKWNVFFTTYKTANYPCCAVSKTCWIISNNPTATSLWNAVTCLLWY